jgi:hypothetical protein
MHHLSSQLACKSSRALHMSLSSDITICVYNDIYFRRVLMHHRLDLCLYEQWILRCTFSIQLDTDIKQGSAMSLYQFYTGFQVFKRTPLDIISTYWTGVPQRKKQELLVLWKYQPLGIDGWYNEHFNYFNNFLLENNLLPILCDLLYIYIYGLFRLYIRSKAG